MNGVLFSVIVPVYNVECYLQQCIDSILYRYISILKSYLYLLCIWL